MTDLTIFDFETSPVRIVLRDEQPWWVATDISSLLGYRDAPNMVRMLDEDQKDTHSVSTLGGVQSLFVISEGGMFTCVIRSKRPEAKRFLRWITDEVLPAIFRTGTYSISAHPEPVEGPHRAYLADDTRYRLDLDAVALYRRLAGKAAALGLWATLGLPQPLATPAIDDGLAAALATWVAGKDRLTYPDIGHGLGIGTPDAAAKRRIADLLTAMGWTYKNTKIAGHQLWLWHCPAITVGPAIAVGESVQ